MAEDYFENGGDDAGSSPQSTDDGARDDSKGGGQTFAINKEAYPDAKPGDMFKMRVESVHEADMMCSVMKDEEQHEDAGGDEAEAMPAEATAPPGMMD